MIASTPLDHKWFAVYTRHKFEKRVSQELSSMQIENYCPVNKVERQWSDRKKIIEVPLFTSYVFVRSTEREHLKVKELDGVLNYVHWLGKPAVIKDKEIDIIKQFLLEHQNITVEGLSVNDRVRITKGPLLSKEGIITEVKSRSVKVYLPSLGFQMMAQVERSNVELIREKLK